MDFEVSVLRERVAQLEKALAAGDEVWVKFGLSTAECRVFAAMMKMPVLRRDSMQLLMANTKDEAVTANAEAVVIFRMRKKLRKHTIKIEIETVPGTGYRLTDEMKDRARGLQ